MSQLPASIAPLLSSIAPNPATTSPGTVSAATLPKPSSSTAPTIAATTTSTKMVMNSSQMQRNKLQNVPAFLNKLYK